LSGPLQRRGLAGSLYGERLELPVTAVRVQAELHTALCSN